MPVAGVMSTSWVCAASVGARRARTARLVGKVIGSVAQGVVDGAELLLSGLEPLVLGDLAFGVFRPVEAAVEGAEAVVSQNV